MTVFEILKFNKELLRRLFETGIKSNDFMYIDLYSDYVRMRKNGDKVTYIVAVLSMKYMISERKVYTIIRRLGKDCKNSTV